MSNIKIFVSHRPEESYPIIDSPLYLNVGCGASSGRQEHAVANGDDTGDNISLKYETYGDLTVQYWAWKNMDSSYYGLFKSNSYLLFHSDTSTKFRNTIRCISANFSEDTIKKYKLDSVEELENTIKNYDVLISKPQKLNSDLALTEADFSKQLGIDDKIFDMCMLILKENFPDTLKYAKEYLKNDYVYLDHLYVMKKEIFNEFCNFQFSILFELEKTTDTSKMTRENMNVFERVGKFLLGVFIYAKLNGSRLKIGMPYHLKFDSQSVRKPDINPVFGPGYIAVVLSSSDFFAPYLGVCIKSIVLNASPENNYDIIVIERGITARNKQRVRAIAEGSSNISIRFMNVAHHIKDANFYVNSDRISQETYYGLLTPWFLPNYEKLIIMDCDMIVKKDIADLYNTPLHDNIGGGVNDIVLQGWLNDPGNDTYNYYINDLQITDPYKCFNGGLILLDLEKYRNTFTWAEVMTYINKYKLRVVDQDIFNILLEGRSLQLDVRWNHMIYLKGAISSAIHNAPATAQKLYFDSQKAPFIIHYASENKPWFNPELEFADEFWRLARQTDFYEVILARMIDKRLGSVSVVSTHQNTVDNRSGARKLADVLLPHGSWKRTLIKRIMPKGSIMWRFFKEIYYIFRPEYRIQNKKGRAK